MWQFSIEAELKFADKNELEHKIDILEAELVDIKSKEILKRNQRLAFMSKEKTLSDSRTSSLEKLAKGIENIKAKINPRCWYGIECRRKFCRFDHRHLFKKDNRNKTPNKTRFEVSQSVFKEFLCDQCGLISENLEMYQAHILCN